MPMNQETALKVVKIKEKQGFQSNLYDDGFFDARGWISDLINIAHPENVGDIKKFIIKINQKPFMKRWNKGSVKLAKIKQKEREKETRMIKKKSKPKIKVNLYALKYAARKRGDMKTYNALDRKIKEKERNKR